MKQILELLKFILRLFGGRKMPIEDIAKNIVKNVVEEAKKAPDALENLVVSETTEFIKGLGEPGLQLGEAYIKAILFGTLVEIDDPAPEMTTEQLGAMSFQEAAQYQLINEKRSEQFVMITKAEAEKQTAAAEVREKAKSFIVGLLSKVGSIGLKVLAAGLVI